MGTCTTSDLPVLELRMSYSKQSSKYEHEPYMRQFTRREGSARESGARGLSALICLCSSRFNNQKKNVDGCLSRAHQLLLLVVPRHHLIVRQRTPEAVQRGPHGDVHLGVARAPHQLQIGD